MNQNVSTLKDKALDWAFAAAIGLEIYWKEDLDVMDRKDVESLGKDNQIVTVSDVTHELRLLGSNGDHPWIPTRNWSQASIVWGRSGVQVTHLTPAARNRRSSTMIGEGNYEVRIGQTVVRSNAPLLALCRAMVIEKFGTQVDIPDELV